MTSLLMRGVVFSPALAFPILFTALAAGCAEGNDDLGTGASGAAQAASSTGAGGAGGEGGSLPTQPDGPPKLTIVNGINDYDAIRLCFVPYPDGGDPPPHPADPAGLPFAAVSIVDPNSSAFPADTDLYSYVVAGDLSKTAGKNCAELTSGAAPAGVLVVPLAVIPASAIAAPRSLLLVPNGCLGGPGHTDPAELAACGPTYSLDTPNPGLVAAGMSRLVEVGAISMQVAQAAPGMPTSDVRILPATGTNPHQVAPSLTQGELGPFPPFHQLSRGDLGSLSSVEIQTYPPGQTAQSSSSPLVPALERGGLSLTDFEDGLAFTLVAVGAQPGAAAGPFWHALTWTVVRADP